MTATDYVLQLPTPDQGPARVLQDGADTLVIVAESTADAKAMAQNLLGAAVWNSVTPAAPVPTDLTDWRLRVRVYDATGVEKVDETVTASGTTAAVAATDSVTIAAGNAADGNTVVVNGVTYTFKTALTPTAGQVLIGAADTDSAANLAAAITGGAGAGTTYATGTTVSPDATAVAASNVVDLTAKTAGTAGNALTLAVTGANLSVGGATFSGGYEAAVSGLAALMVTALNATGVMAHAAYNVATTTLTIASAADNIGNYTASVEVYPPQVDSPSPNGVSVKQGVAIPGYVGTITDGGVAGAALTAVLVADSYTVPTIAVKARTE